VFEINPVSISPFHLSLDAVFYIGPSAGPHNATRDKLTIPWAPSQQNLSLLSLLTWQTRISTFAGRDTEMTALEAWAGSKLPISLKFITGDGGIGKSRLAAEFADSLSRRQWAAGFVNLTDTKAYPLGKRGTLLVVDYPEENRQHVAELLTDIAKIGKSKHHLRVLFLTRQSLEVWRQFVADNHADRLLDQEALEPGKLDAPSAHKLYLSTLGEASTIFNTVPIPVSQADLFAWLEQAPENSRALFVLAAAVHTAIHPDDEVIRYTGREVVEELARRERTRLRQIAINRSAPHPDVFARLLAMAAIAGDLPLSRVAALALDVKLLLGLPEAVNPRSELQAAGIVEGDAVNAPKPDIVASAFVIQTLADADEAATALVWSALENDLRGGLGRIARLGHDADVTLGIHTPRIGAWLAEAVRDQPQRCTALLEALDYVPSLALTAAAIVAAETLLVNAHDDDTKARLENNLSVFLSETGDTPGALGAIREAVELYRRLAAASPARYEPDLAMSLNNLSNYLRETGDTPGALAAIREAVELRRRLAAASPARYEPDLAMSLNNLSNHLSETGDTPGALAAIREAVELRRRLAAASPARYEPDLANSLNNLSNHLSEMGDTPGALAAIREAVELYRRLAAASPARYEPDLAMSLNNLSVFLSETGDTPGALAAIREAVELRWRLAAASPARYEPDLAMSLNNLSNRLSETGDTQGALGAIREAVELYRRLAAASPARYEPDLARSLGTLGTILSKLGRHIEARKAFKEAVERVRPYAQQWPHGPAALLLAALESGLRRTPGTD